MHIYVQTGKILLQVLQGVFFFTIYSILKKTSKNKEQSIKLLEYLSSAEAQNEYASANKEYPVLIGAQVDESIASWGEFIEDTIGVEKLGKLQKDAVFLAQETDYK